MSSGLRQVELVEDSNSGSHTNQQRIDHVVGVDESGNSNEGPFVMTAVQCPRSCGETIAELLINEGLEPWKSKASSTPAHMSNQALTDGVSELIDNLTDTPITWHAVGGWGSYEKQARAMIACIVTTKAMTGGHDSTVPEYDGPATLMHDGGNRMYGDSQIAIRRAASRQFSGFADRHTPVYLSFIRDGDKTYPEVTAADYISAYLRSEIQSRGIENIDYLDRIDNSWCASSHDPPATLYQIRARRRGRPQEKEERAAAWIEGRRPPDSDSWNGSQLDSLVSRLKSDTVREYLLNDL